MIPKTIHYCWFGGKRIPSEYQRYIDSWKRFLPDYEIKRWDEHNFDVNCIPFCKEAYEVGKYAYVSDYARLKILYEHGGVYFDTDVEVIRPMDDLMACGPWMGVEKHVSSPESSDQVNVGLGFAVEPKNPIIREVLDFYESHHYIYPDGHMEQIPIVPIVTEVLRKYGMPDHIIEPTMIKTPTSSDSITIYPWDYLCPIEFMSTKLELTLNTYTIHHYSATWMSKRDKFNMWKGYIVRSTPFLRILKSLCGS